MDNRREIRIFLSSTFRDLNEERNYLTNIIFPICIRKARKRDVAVTVVDLRWGIKEEKYILKIMDICFSEIDKARPHFIGIIGDRYGFVPGTQDYQDYLYRYKNIKNKDRLNEWRKNGLSLTNMEMEYGVFLNPELAKYAYFYFKSEKLIERREESKEFEERLTKLKQKIRVKNSKWYWHTPYSTLNELGDQVTSDFFKVLDEEFPVKNAPTTLEREKSIQRQYSSFLLTTYVQQDQITRKIFNLLENYRRVIVTGPVGIGKSSMLAQCAVIYKEMYPDALVIEHYIGAGGSDSGLGILIKIREEVKERLKSHGISIEEAKGGTVEEIGEQLEKLIIQLQSLDKPLLIIDGLDQLSDQNDARILRYIPYIFLLVSSRDKKIIIDYYQQLGFVGQSVHPLTRQKKEVIIEKVLRRNGKELTKNQINNKLAASKYTSNPLYLRILLDELNKMEEEKLPSERQNEFMDRKIEEYLQNQAITDLYKLLIKRLEDINKKYTPESGESVQNLLISIGLSRGGLSQNEILSITKMSTSVFLLLRNELDYHLSEKNGLFDFFHFSLKQAVYSFYLKSPEKEKEERGKIISWFGEQNAVDDRQAFELPYQLMQTGNKDKLKLYLSKIEVFNFFYGNGIKYYEFMEYIRYSLNNLCDEIDKLYEPIAISNDSSLLGKLGFLFEDLGCYRKAEPLFKRALDIDEKISGNDDSNVATDLNNLGKLYHVQERYKEAEPLFKRALTIDEKVYGKDHWNIARDLNNLAWLYHNMGKFEDRSKLNEAELLFKRAIKIDEKVYGSRNPIVATDFSNLAWLYHVQGRYKEAEPLFKRALAIDEKSLGWDDPAVSRDLNNIAWLYHVEGKYEARNKNQAKSKFTEAEQLFKRAIVIDEKVYGKDHPNIARDLNSLAWLYHVQYEFKKEEPLFKRALAIDEKSFGTNHPDVARDLNNLGMLYHVLGRYQEGEILFQSSLKIYQNIMGKEYSEVAKLLKNLGLLYIKMGKKIKAIKYLNHSYRIYKKFPSMVEDTDEVLKALNELEGDK